MSMSDPIADMLTRIRNAQAVDKAVVTMPSSKIKIAIAQVLKDEGYIKNFRLMREEGRPVIKVYLKYTDGGASVIQGIRRVSKPGLRRYSGYEGMPRPLGGAGIAIVSTSAGVMTNKDARRRKLGGEIICEVY